MTTPEILASTFSLLAFVTAIVSLYFTLRTGSLPQVQSEVRQLSLDVTELYDKVEHWTRRDRVRKLREGQEAAAEKRASETPAVAELNGSNKARKAQLRARVFGSLRPKDSVQ